jgi:hypothetical protein
VVLQAFLAVEPNLASDTGYAMVGGEPPGLWWHSTEKDSVPMRLTFLFDKGNRDENV